MKKKKIIVDFFGEYSQRFNRILKGEVVSIEETINCFASYFVEASTGGVMGSRNDEEFHKMIPQGYDYYRSIGITQMNIRAIDVTELDTIHAMAKVSWQSVYQKNDRTGAIDFEVIYFVQTKDAQPKIFAFITGDEQMALREHGLLPFSN